MQQEINAILDNVCENPDLLIAYAKKGCPSCQGKGYILRNNVESLLVLNKELCSCVIKNVRKEVTKM